MKPILNLPKPRSMGELHALLVKHEPIANQVGRFVAALDEPAYNAASAQIHLALSNSQSPYSFEVIRPDGTITHSTWLAANALFIHAIALNKGMSREDRDRFLDITLNGRSTLAHYLPAVDPAADRIREQMRSDIPSVELFFNRMLDRFKGPETSQSTRKPISS